MSHKESATEQMQKRWRGRVGPRLGRVREPEKYKSIKAWHMVQAGEEFFFFFFLLTFN